jgi:hypothetical protein
MKVARGVWSARPPDVGRMRVVQAFCRGGRGRSRRVARLTLILISLAFSWASWRMKFTIWRICAADPSAMVPGCKTCGNRGETRVVRPAHQKEGM